MWDINSSSLCRFTSKSRCFQMQCDGVWRERIQLHSNQEVEEQLAPGASPEVDAMKCVCAHLQPLPESEQ